MPLEGGCACGAIRYKLNNTPLIVHACHCRDCRRLSGTAFATNIWIEEKFVKRGQAAPASFRLKGGSGQPHDVFFCERCGTTVWSRYHPVPWALFVPAGTLDEPDAVEPDLHIFTRSKVPWLQLPPGARVFETFYKLDEVWPAESLERRRLARTEQP
jgi:hypothetical protein